MWKKKSLHHRADISIFYPERKHPSFTPALFTRRAASAKLCPFLLKQLTVNNMLAQRWSGDGVGVKGKRGREERRGEVNCCRGPRLCVEASALFSSPRRN